MENSLKYFDDLRALIASGRIEEALSSLTTLLKNSSYLNEAIINSSRNAELKRNIRMGLLDPQTIDIQSNNIKASILDLIDEIESTRSGSPLIREETDRFLERFVSTINTQNQTGDNQSIQGNTFEGISYIAGTINNYYSGPTAEDAGVKSLACPYCGREAIPEEVQDNGKVMCKNPKCGKQFFELKPVRRGVTRHLNVPEEHNKEYDDLIFRVNHHILLGEYAAATTLCEEAFAKHPQSPAGLEYKALCLYLTTSKIKLMESSASAIIVCLKQAQEIDATSQSYEGIARTIAYKYYGHLKARINHTKNKQDNLFSLRMLVDQFETCFRIYQDPFFLKEKIRHLSGHEGLAFFRLFHNDGSVSVDITRDIQLADESGQEYIAKDLSGYERGVEQEIKTIAGKIRAKDPNYIIPDILAITDEFLMEYGRNFVETQDTLLPVQTFYLISINKFIEYRNNRIEKIKAQARQEDLKLEAKIKRVVTAIGAVILILLGFYLYNSFFSESAQRKSFLKGIRSGEEYTLTLDKVRLRPTPGTNKNIAPLYVLSLGDRVQFKGERQLFQVLEFSNGETGAEWMKVAIVQCADTSKIGVQGWIHPGAIIP